jgi:hypothetical protein
MPSRWIFSLTSSRHFSALPHRFGTHRFPEHQTRWASFDDKILSLYAHGMTVREVPGQSNHR